MKDRTGDVLIAFLLVILFFAFIAVEWDYIGKIIFALLFGSSFLLPSMWIVIFASAVTLIFLQKVVEADEK